MICANCPAQRGCAYANPPLFLNPAIVYSYISNSSKRPMTSLVEIHEFFVEGSKQEKSHVLLHITEPSTPEEIDKGYLFAIAEVRFGTIGLIEHIQQLITDIESGYYQTADAEDKSAFEATMEFVNRRAASFMNPENTTFHCLIGVLKDNTLSLAYHGIPLALLFYQGKQGIETMNIIQEEDEESEQIFSSIVQGEINPHDFVFLTTPAVIEYFSLDRLQKIITSRTTRQTTEHIQKVLEDLDSENSFGGILFRLLPQSEAPKTGKQPLTLKQGSAASLNRFIAAQKHTAETLSPPIIDQFTKQIKSKLQKRGKRKEAEQELKKRHCGQMETNFRPRSNTPQMSWFNTILIYIGRGLVSAALVLFRILKRILQSTGKGLLMLFILLTNKNNGRQEMISVFKDGMERKKRFLSALPLPSKFLLAITLVAAVAFIGSLSYFKIKEGIEAKQQAYAATLQAAQDKKDAADASLIYGDTTKAFTLLQEAKTMLASFTPKKKDEERRNQIVSSIEESLRKLRKMALVTPQVLVDLSTAATPIKAERIASIGDWLVVYGKDDKVLYRFNRNTNSSEFKEFDAAFHPIGDTTPKEQDAMFMLGTNNKVAEYNAENGTLSPRDITYPGTEPHIVDIFLYNSRLYTLDQKQQKLYKHSKTQTGFDKGTPWITETNVDLSSATALAIDGDIFILTANTLLKFSAGKLGSFSTPGLDPALTNPTDIWTYNDVNNIYILEPTNKRVIVISKEGELQQQYTADNWQNPTGMVVDEKNKIIYILDSNIVYSFGI